MKRTIQFIFGKPDPESKFRIFYYWFGISVYFAAMIMFIIQTAIFGNLSSLFVLLFPAIGFPLLFRIVYAVNTRIHKGIRGKNKRIFIIVTASFFGIILLVTVLSLFTNGANVVFNSQKTNFNGSVRLTVGSLKGSYDIEQFSISQSEKVSIPYEASAQEGDLTLMVKDSSQTVWAKNISPSDKGNIEFEAKKEDYFIEINTIKAKKIEVKLSLK